MALFLFAGQTCCEEQDGVALRGVCDHVRRAAGEMGVVLDEVRVCFAPEHTDRTWAIYEPTSREVASCGGDWWTAERKTQTVPALRRDLTASASEVWAAMDEAFERFGFLVLCGCSNGCLVAMEYASTHPERVRALLMLSGLPSVSQQRAVTAGYKRLPPTCFTVGTWETYFGGRDAFESVATALACSLVEFPGKHNHEDAATVCNATRTALRVYPDRLTAAW